MYILVYNDCKLKGKFAMQNQNKPIDTLCIGEKLNFIHIVLSDEYWPSFTTWFSGLTLKYLLTSSSSSSWTLLPLRFCCCAQQCRQTRSIVINIRHHTSDYKSMQSTKIWKSKIIQKAKAARVIFKICHLMKANSPCQERQRLQNKQTRNWFKSYFTIILWSTVFKLKDQAKCTCQHTN